MNNFLKFLDFALYEVLLNLNSVFPLLRTFVHLCTWSRNLYFLKNCWSISLHISLLYFTTPVTTFFSIYIASRWLMSHMQKRIIVQYLNILTALILSKIRCNAFYEAKYWTISLISREIKVNCTKHEISYRKHKVNYKKRMSKIWVKGNTDCIKNRWIYYQKSNICFIYDAPKVILLQYKYLNVVLLH